MELIKACFADAILEENYLWVFDNRIQSLCKINIDNFEIEIVSSYKGEKKFNARKVFLFENRFYFTAVSTVEILVYDRGRHNELSIFRLLKPPKEYNSGMFMSYGYDDCIYFLPSFIGDKIVWFDTSKNKYFENVMLESSVKEMLGNKKLTVGYSCAYEDIIWFPIRETPYYAKYNMPQKKLNLFQAEGDNIKLSGICFDGRNIWLTENDNNNIVCVGKQPINILGGHIYSWIYNATNYIIISTKSAIIFIDKKTLEVITRDLLDVVTKKKQSEVANIVNFSENNDYIFLFLHGINDLIVFHKKTLRIEKKRLKCEYYSDNCFLGEKSFMDESEDIGIKHLVQFLGGNVDSVDYIEPKSTIGEKVWEIVKGEVLG